jgi:hypothetical protein
VQPEHVHITPVLNNAGALVSRELVMAGPYSVQFKGQLTLTTQGGGFTIATGIGQSPQVSGFQCELLTGFTNMAPPRIFVGQDGAGNEIQISGLPVDTHLVFRLVAPATLPGSLNCRADYGFEVGYEMKSVTTFTPGSVGVVAYQDDVDVDAIAIYGTASACPVPIVR